MSDSIPAVPLARVTITGTYPLVVEHYPDDVSTPAQAASFDQQQLDEGHMPARWILQWVEESGPVEVTVEAVDP